MRRGNTPKDSLRQRFRVLLRRADFRRSPLKAIYRRLVWRLRWKLYPNSPWLIRAQSDLPLLTPKCSAGALIYYQGASEPDTADFISRFLRPGMVFVDVGAHLGEYSVLASALVKPSGRVHSFEPCPDMLVWLRRNLRLNDCDNVLVLPEAVSDDNLETDFELTPEPSLSALRTAQCQRREAQVIRVRTLSLDQYFSRLQMALPKLIKIDVEGAELQVLKGATSLLTRSSKDAPVIVFEYEPRNTERFGYSVDDIIKLLHMLGFEIYGWRRDGPYGIGGCTSLQEMGFRGNLIATKLPPSDLSKALLC